MKGIQLVQTIKRRDRWYVQGYGRTPKGVKFLLAETELEALSITDPKFKSEQAAAVTQMRS